MDAYLPLIQTLALVGGLGWASGIKVYAAVLTLGVLGLTGSAQLPPGLEVLEHPAVIGGAALMYMAEFFADKIPGVDSLWDAVHTFVRIPAGAALAFAAVGPVDPSLQAAAGLVGGGLATTMHATKAGARLILNTSPEPFSNWAASFTEDVLVFGGLWLALQHPLLFALMLCLLMALIAWLLPKLWCGVIALARRIAGWFGRPSRPSVDDLPA